MKAFLYNCILPVVLLLMIGCSTGDIVVEDFEGDLFTGWTVEGEAFGDGPVLGRLSRQQDVSGFEGMRLANSYHNGDNSLGVLISDPFTIKREYINFLLGGGMHNGTYVELIVEGESVYTDRPLIESEMLLWTTWDVKSFKGKKARFRIVDNQQGAWGHILVDRIEMSNRRKSTILETLRLSFQVDKKYLLIPIEDKAPELQIYLETGGKIVSPRLDIRVAQTQVDYWMPVPVEAFAGTELTLVFTDVRNDAAGYSQIRLSDRVDFVYNETWRPVYHFTPQYGWTNDPIGLVYYEEEYHLFFQHNPLGAVWGNMTWGHSVSKDLKKWEYLPNAIMPDSLGMIYSGSVVIDRENTAGFGKDAMVAIYTSHGKTQRQCLAYSLDSGRTFTKYEGNPVLSDPNNMDFRDPKVFWHEQTGRWIMALATTQAVTFYASSDLKEWEWLSSFSNGTKKVGVAWECPDLFPLTYNGSTKWVLLVSTNPGSPNGGSAVQYFIGDFDGREFKADTLPYPLWLDYGCDNYGFVTWNNAPANRTIGIGWMSNWEYANATPTVNFRNAMTVTRSLQLKHNGHHLILAQTAVKEIDDMRSDVDLIPNIIEKRTYTVNRLLPKNSGAYELEMTIYPGKAEKVSFTLSNNREEVLVYTFDKKNEQLIVDRSKSGQTSFDAGFAATNIQAPLTKKESYSVRLLVDVASAELFVDGGEVVSTNIVFPTEPYNALEFSADAPVSIRNIRLYGLR